MSESIVRTSLIALAQAEDEHVIEECFAKTEELLESKEMRKDLTPSVSADALGACKSKEAGDRVLSILLHSFILQPTNDSAYCICHFIVNFGQGLSTRTLNSIVKEEMIAAASSILMEELPADGRNAHIDAFLEVARSLGDEGLYIPALILSNHLHQSSTGYDVSNILEDVESRGSWKTRFVELLGCNIFCINGNSTSVANVENKLLSKLIQILTVEEFEQSIITSFKNNIALNSNETIETISTIISVVGEGEAKKELIISNLKPPTDLIGWGVKQIKSGGEDVRNMAGSTLLVEIIKISPSSTIELVVNALSEALQESFENEQTNERQLVYGAFEFIAEHFSLSGNEDIFTEDIKKSLKHVVDAVVVTLTGAAEKEEEQEEQDEDCTCAANSASETWSYFMEKITSSEPEDEEILKPAAITNDEEILKPAAIEMPKTNDEEILKPAAIEMPKINDEEILKPAAIEMPKTNDEEILKPASATMSTLVAAASFPTHNKSLTQDSDGLIKSRVKAAMKTAPTADLLGKATVESDEQIKSRSRRESNDATPPAVGVVFEDSNKFSGILNSKIASISGKRPIATMIPTRNESASTVQTDNLIKSRARAAMSSAPTADLLGKSPIESDEQIKSRARRQPSDTLPPTVGVVFEDSENSLSKPRQKSNIEVDLLGAFDSGRDELIKSRSRRENNSDPNTSDSELLEDSGSHTDNSNKIARSFLSIPEAESNNDLADEKNVTDKLLSGYDDDVKDYSKGCNNITQIDSADAKNAKNLVFDVTDDGLAKYTTHKDDEDGLVNGLVTAKLVEEDEYDYDLPISYAHTYVEKVPFHKNRRVITYTLGLIIVLVIVIFGTSLAATKKVIEKGIITEAPSEAPSSSPTSFRDTIGIWQRLSMLSGSSILDAKSGDTDLQRTPQYLAANWLINEDKRQLDVDADNLEQRYILALIYFSTNGHTWNYCNSDPNEVLCTYTDAILNTNFTESRFLSESHECEWYQTICSKDNVVREVRLYQNNLLGRIPTEIAELSKLTRLRLNANSLSGTLPSELGRMRHLADLEVHSNLLHGTVPEEIFNIDTLQALNMAMNNFEGTIPDKFDNLKNLKGIHLFDNSFTGPIPQSLVELPYITFIYMQENKLNGTIPSKLFEKERLKQVILFQNHLTGSLPPLGKLHQLEHLMLHDNELEGTLPEDLYELKKLHWLFLQNNKFSGEILPDIENLVSLRKLFFRKNNFHGTIPVEIGNLEHLEQAMFQFNKFDGSIPENVCELKKLESLFADCLGDWVSCECCTDCCDRDQEICHEE